MSDSLVSAEGFPDNRFPCDLPVPHPQHIERFKALCLRHYGLTLTDDEAHRALSSLLVLVKYQQANARFQEQQQARR